MPLALGGKIHRELCHGTTGLMHPANGGAMDSRRPTLNEAPAVAVSSQAISREKQDGMEAIHSNTVWASKCRCLRPVSC